MEQQEKKLLMADSMGKFRTQSLFLELGYGEEAVFTLKDDDHTLNGKTYVSLKKLYLAEDNPMEYEFANKHLLGWKHWQRLCDNKIIAKHIAEWRDELEIKIRAAAVREALKQSRGGTFQASKWIADRGWNTRAAGRPSKADVDHEKKILAGIDQEYSADVVRMFQKQG